MDQENFQQIIHGGVSDGSCSPLEIEASRSHPLSCQNINNDAGLVTCRVCHCAESDKRGDAALEFLGIITPSSQSVHKSSEGVKSNGKDVLKVVEKDCHVNNGRSDSGFVEFVSPKGEVFICKTDIEMGIHCSQNMLFELGCSCKNDLALVHYACALKWFVNHGSTICEICGCAAKNIKDSDFRKVVGSLMEYEVLKERTASGVPIPTLLQTGSSVDPDAIAAIRRQRLSEISLWFSPHGSCNLATVSPFVTAPSIVAPEEVLHAENPATKWAVEGTGILLATGLLTVTLAWLIAPRVGKKTAKSGLHILLGGICALTIVIFFRFFVLTRIRYGPSRYWAILFVFWFLVFGIWASRTHGAHAT